MPISAKRIAKYINDLDGRSHNALLAQNHRDYEDASEAYYRTLVQYVYVIEAVGTDLVKIGVSDSPEKRIHQHQTSSPHKLRLLGYCLGSYAIEQALHLVLNEYRVRGEWFRNEGLCADAVKAISQGDFEAVGDLLN